MAFVEKKKKSARCLMEGWLLRSRVEAPKQASGSRRRHRHGTAATPASPPRRCRRRCPLAPPRQRRHAGGLGAILLASRHCRFSLRAVSHRLGQVRRQPSSYRCAISDASPATPPEPRERRPSGQLHYFPARAIRRLLSRGPQYHSRRGTAPDDARRRRRRAQLTRRMTRGARAIDFFLDAGARMSPADGQKARKVNGRRPMKKKSFR